MCSIDKIKSKQFKKQIKQHLKEREMTSTSPRVARSGDVARGSGNPVDPAVSRMISG